MKTWEMLEDLIAMGLTEKHFNCDLCFYKNGDSCSSEGFECWFRPEITNVKEEYIQRFGTEKERDCFCSECGRFFMTKDMKKKPDEDKENGLCEKCYYRISFR